MMPKIPVDECPAGPEMDAAVAKALGLTVQWQQWVGESQRPMYLTGTFAAKYDDWAEHEDWRQVLPYSTDIAAAWEFAPGVLNGKHLVFVGTHWAIWHFDEYDNMPNDAIAETASHAVCRAFLKANGIEYVEMPG